MGILRQHGLLHGDKIVVPHHSRFEMYFAATKEHIIVNNVNSFMDKPMDIDLTIDHANELIVGKYHSETAYYSTKSVVCVKVQYMI